MREILHVNVILAQTKGSIENYIICLCVTYAIMNKKGVKFVKYSLIVLSFLLCLSSVCVGEANISLQETQSLNLNSVGNARELGGYPTVDGRKVKSGVLLRTAALYGISSDDVTRLTKNYHLAVIADLRMSLEVAPKPDPAIEGVKYLNLRVINEDLFNQELEKKLSVEGDAIARLNFIIDSGFVSYDMYVGFLSEESGKKAYSEFFRELLDLPPERSLLFHCTQGKDRTGCAAMLILSALGVSEDTIMEDYMLTNVFNAKLIDGQRKMLLSHGIKESELEKYMLILDEVNPKTMNTVLAWLKENYGSPVGYIINELGVSADDIEQLKAKFLEGE